MQRHGVAKKWRHTGLQHVDKYEVCFGSSLATGSMAYTGGSPPQRTVIRPPIIDCTIDGDTSDDDRPIDLGDLREALSTSRRDYMGPSSSRPVGRRGSKRKEMTVEEKLTYAVNNLNDSYNASKKSRPSSESLNQPPEMVRVQRVLRDMGLYAHPSYCFKAMDFFHAHKEHRATFMEYPEEMRGVYLTEMVGPIPTEP